MKLKSLNNRDLIYSSPEDPKSRVIKLKFLISIIFNQLMILLFLVIMIESIVEYIYRRTLIFSNQNILQIILINVLFTFIIFLIYYWIIYPKTNQYLALNPLIVKKQSFLPSSPIYPNNKYNRIQYQKTKRWINYSEIYKIILVNELEEIKTSSDEYLNKINTLTIPSFSLLGLTETVKKIITFETGLKENNTNLDNVNILHFDTKSNEPILKIIILFPRKEKRSEIDLFFNNPLFHNPSIDYVIITENSKNGKSLSILIETIKQFWKDRIVMVS